MKEVFCIFSKYPADIMGPVLTRFYVLWRWEFGSASVPFDDAKKLAQSCGVDLSMEWSRSGFINKDKEFIKVLGSQDRNSNTLKYTSEMIDALHKAVLLWENSKREEMIALIHESGYGKSEAFFGMPSVGEYLK